jgi:uncharacterized 2Fe-2S/4Fe-4S cluster protein (DUF4445 family)
MEKYEVTFEPEGIRVRVGAGQTIMEAANEAGIILNNVCGGVGTCQKCLVELDGSAEPVRACQHRIEGNLKVNIPAGSRFFAQKILQTGIAPRVQGDPCVRKYYVEPEPAHLGDLRSDSARLADANKFLSLCSGGREC